jgi:amino acid transporter
MNQEKGTLVRGLTLVTVFTLITGAMVGMAWATIINALFEYAGPAILLSALLAAVFSVLIGLCYAELCSAMPYAGGEYHYTRRALGKFASFITGWFLIIAYSSMMPAEVIIFSRVAGSLMPEAWLQSGILTVGSYTFPPLAMIIVGVVIAIFFGVVNYIGIRISAIAQLIFTIVLFGGIATYVIGGIPHVDMANFGGNFFDKGIAGMFMMVPIAMLAFMGFDVVPQAAEEIKSPIRKVVFLIPLSVIFVLIFYSGVFFVSAGVVPYEEIAMSTEEVPILPIAQMTIGTVGASIVIVAGLMGLITTLNAFMIGSSRLMLGMAREGVLPAALGKIHPKYGTPAVGIIVLTILGLVGCFFDFLLTLFQVASAAILVAYILVCISLFVLRKKEPGMERPFRMPAAWLLGGFAILGAVLAELFAIYMLIEDKEVLGTVLFFGLTAVGLLYYIFVARKKSGGISNT